MIQQYRPKEMSVQRACELLDLPRSTFYAKPTPHPNEDELVNKIEAVIERFPGYGYRRVAAALKLPEKKIRTLMRRLGYLAKPKKRKKRTTFPVPIEAENLIRTFRLDRCEQVLVADATALPLPRGKWAYLAAVMDLFSRQIRGFAIGLRLDSELCVRALQQARPISQGWIHHSDRGATYASFMYRAAVVSAGGNMSFSRAGRPIENAAMESFFKTLKQELVYINEHNDLAELGRSIAMFIHQYNSERLHSSLGYRSPDQFAAQYAQLQT